MFSEVLPPLPLDFGPARGRECLWAFVCRVRARSFSSSSFGRWGRGSWLSCCRRPFPASPSLLTLPNSHRTFHDVRIRGSLQSLAPAFYPPASHALQSVARGVDKRARSREVSSRGRRSRSSYRSRLSGRERGRRSSSASRSSRGRSRCERSRSSDRYRSQRGCSRSRRAWSRSSDRYRPRRDRSRRERSRSFDRYRSRRERARSPAWGAARSFAIARSPESLAWPLAVKRAITCFSCLLAGRGSRTAGQTWAPGGCGGVCLSASCGLEQRRASLLFWRGVHCRSPVCFCRSLPSS